MSSNTDANNLKAKGLSDPQFKQPTQNPAGIQPQIKPSQPMTRRRMALNS